MFFPPSNERAAAERISGCEFVVVEGAAHGGLSTHPTVQSETSLTSAPDKLPEIGQGPYQQTRHQAGKCQAARVGDTGRYSCPSRSIAHNTFNRLRARVHYWTVASESEGIDTVDRIVNQAEVSDTFI